MIDISLLNSIFDNVTEYDSKEYFFGYVHKSNIDCIVTDFKYNLTVTGNGYMNYQLSGDGEYVVYKDINNNTVAYIYKYALVDTNTIISLARNAGLIDGDNNEINTSIDNDVININTFRCTECGNADLIYSRRENNNEYNCKCGKCNTIYVLVPSKYYAIRSKTKAYNINTITPSIIVSSNTPKQPK